MTPDRLFSAVREATAGWRFDVLSIGYPGRVVDNAPQEDAPNLGKGWIRFDFRAAFRRPVRILNDAALQAVGSYRGGRMLFLGLGTGLGSALILEGVVHATELGDLPYKRGRPFSAYLSKAALKRLGYASWSRHVLTAVNHFKSALQVDYVVLGGGKAKLVGRLPSGVVRGDNSKAYLGGVRAWQGPRRRGSQIVFI
jgi:polyphosphate glucokinase